jgi:hypothetical protein
MIIHANGKHPAKQYIRHLYENHEHSHRWDNAPTVVQDS